MNNTYSIDELSRMSPEEVYGFDPIDLDMDAEEAAERQYSPAEALVAGEYACRGEHFLSDLAMKNNLV
jgi:hypothetical protein